MNVGFVGLGRMGSQMAANLVKAGHTVTVFNRTREPSAPLVALGARRAETLAEACTGEVVITMLSDDTAASSVTLGRGGLIEHLAEGAIHVSMSTISVALSRQLAQAHARERQRFVAAPVFGRPEMAAAAKLFIVAGGEPHAIERCQPLFDALGQSTTVIGIEPAAANLVKLSGNFLIASAIEALGEAITLISKAGVDPTKYVEFLTGSLFTAPAYRIYGGLIAEGRFQPAGFAAPLGYKDIRLALEAAEALRVPMPLASLLRDRFLRLLAQGGQDLDWSAIAGLAAVDAHQANE